MRSGILILAVSWGCAAAGAADIPSGSHLLLRMVNSINTRTAREGDFVYLRTASPISVDGRILVPVDSYVQGVVSESRRSGRVAGRAELGIKLETLTLPSGKVVRFAPHVSAVDSHETDQAVRGKEDVIKQGGDIGQDAKRIAILAGTGAGLGGLADRSWSGAGIGAGAGTAVGFAAALMTRGREVELHQGATLDVVFDRPVTVE
jgi:type IV secretion system protein VirB10